MSLARDMATETRDELGRIADAAELVALLAYVESEATSRVESAGCLERIAALRERIRGREDR